MNGQRKVYGSIIGLVGDALSGKSTYLATLESYLSQIGGDFNIIPTDDYTAVHFGDYFDRIKTGAFPLPTSVIRDFDFRIKNNNVSARIITKDRSGGDIDRDNETEGFKTTIEDLTNCNGILFFINLRPKNVNDRPEMKNRLLEDLLGSVYRKVVAEKEITDEFYKLDHRVAICFTQYDDVGFFKYGLHNEIFSSWDSLYLQNIPIVKKDEQGEIDFDTLVKLLSWFEDADKSLCIFQKYFDSKKINFYVLSSIGFYYDQNKRVDWNNCNNIEELNTGQSTEYIRSTASGLYPIGLMKPIEFLVQSHLVDENRLPALIEGLRSAKFRKGKKHGK